MFNNLKNMSKTKKGGQKTLDKSFAKSILSQAEKAVHAYHFLLEEHEGLGYTASCAELPTVFGNGKSPDECVRAIKKALAYTIATMLESGQTPPQPFTEKKRDVQVNVRLTYEEKLVLAQASHSHGFKGLSDFVRTCALQHIRCLS